MSQFMHEHPWMTLVIAVLIIDVVGTVANNFAKAALIDAKRGRAGESS